MPIYYVDRYKIKFMNDNNKIIKARLILEVDKKVLLLAQTNENGGKYTLVGGTVEKMEFARKTLIRECREEIGIKLDSNDLEVIHILHKKNKKEDRITIYFTTKKWAKEIECREKDKFIEAAWFPLCNLPAETSSTVQHVLEQIQRGTRYSEFFVGGEERFKKIKRKAKKIKRKAKKQLKKEILRNNAVIAQEIPLPKKESTQPSPILETVEN